MTWKRSARLSVDALMLALLFMLLAYPLTRGLLRHGIFGICFFCAILAHLGFNWRFWPAIFHGAWSAPRILLTLADLLLLVCFAAMAISSLAMAGDVFSFIPFPMPWWGRELHTACAAWILVLAAFHLGLHGGRFWKRIKQLTGRGWLAALIVAILVSGYLFLQSGVWQNLLLISPSFKNSHTIWQFVAWYGGGTLFLCLLARVTLKNRQWLDKK